MHKNGQSERPVQYLMMALDRSFLAEEAAPCHGTAPARRAPDCASERSRRLQKGRDVDKNKYQGPGKARITVNEALLGTYLGVKGDGWGYC